ncbi:MAG: hypothetical protein ACIAQZ_06360 [Sedimentisphaeraceae bacterium JB056]
MSQDNDRSVTIMRFFDINEAEFAAEILDGEGIKCGLIGANFFNAYYFAGIASKGIQLEVMESDVQKAIEILKANIGSGKKAAVEVAEEISDADFVCPQCGSCEVVREKFERKSFFLTLLFLGFPVPFRNKKVECMDCGHKWKLS